MFNDAGDRDPDLSIREVLDPGERLLWSGRPQQGLLLRSSDWLYIPLSLLWCGFAVAWEALQVLTGGSLFFVLWGIPFVLAGLYLVVGRFFADARRRKKTYYAVTERRILIVPGPARRRVKSIDLKSVSESRLIARRDGRGTIELWDVDEYPLPPLELIPDAQKVHEIIRQAQGGPSWADTWP